MSGHPWRNAAIALLVGSVSLLEFQTTYAQTAATVGQHRDPILVSGVKEPEEMRVEPRPTPVPTEPERMLAVETKGGTKMNDPAILLPALNRVLAKFPDYSDGYAMRAGSLCAGSDRAAVLADINNALKHVDNSRVKESAASLLSMRAKIEHLNGNDADALADLENAIKRQP